MYYVMWGCRSRIIDCLGLKHPWFDIETEGGRERAPLLSLNNTMKVEPNLCVFQIDLLPKQLLRCTFKEM